MNSSINIDSIPLPFKYLIPTKLEVDGIKFPLTHEIDIGNISKTYGHYRIRIVLMGIIKTKALVVDANKTSILIQFKFQNKKWYYYLISFAVTIYLIYIEPQTRLTLVISACIFIILVLIDLLINFVEIQEANPPSR